MFSTTSFFILTFFTSTVILSGVYGRSFSELPKYEETSSQLKGGKFNGGKGACPNGSVPIITTNTNNSFSVLAVQKADTTCIAVVRTNDQNKKFYGAEGAPSLNKPKVNPAQWSAARMKLSNGVESIEAGWMVNPTIFKDQEAHFYVRFQNGGGGCLNTECPGFVHVPEGVPLGMIPASYSQDGGQQYTWRLFIDKHQDDGHWWLSQGDGKSAIGYWPKTLFSGLADHATQVEWGGEVRPDGTLPVPQMGYGQPPHYSSSTTAFFQHVTVVDESLHNANPVSTEKYWNCYYTSLDWGYQGDYWGRLIFYGGPP
ncbi:hypothetical protein RND81_14G199800 [Saponaria officinalis]|uniref:Neprosin PEP catalytic domain-containing protein n=1 Tax=Saponaria officinalis TaxID=3572 RepID=A0AAW1GP27_SAPOF